MKSALSVLLLFIYSFSFSQFSTEIKGIAPAYIGKTVQFLTIQDYFSYKDSIIAETIVNSDSTFNIKLPINKTQKIYIKSNKNKGYIYVEPNKKYTVFLPEKDEFNVYNPLGNEIEIKFYNIDSNDVNVKIIEFDRWVNNFMGLTYNRSNLTTPIFSQKLDTFKMNVQKYYEKDTSTFFKTYVKYSIATLDDINYVGYKSRYEKYEFYIKNSPIFYNNEMYMKYISLFYKKILGRYPTELNDKIYKSILYSSPTMLSKSLNEDVALKNPKLRELILIKALSEVYFGNEYPKSNILTILDSVQKKPLFKENGLIAKNLIYRLTQLNAGMKAPDFFVGIENQDSLNLSHFNGKHTYIQFVDLSLEDSQKEIEILKTMYARYKNYVEFFTIVDEIKPLTKKQKEYYQQIPWKKSIIHSQNDILSKYKIKNYPDYVFIDDQGFIYQYPALKPTPNGDLETIEKSFYTVKRKIETEKANMEKNSMDNVYGDD
jgi:hypothetical protein